ncbi:MAG: hypothetical protein QOC80_2359 [Frankiaceae bacterium]|jgi:hypothetical protein|nr:hypothetical protein [Frankiaceae bacterium]MEA2612653.1 hypothetical protein [Chloroflexota bacterium]
MYAVADPHVTMIRPVVPSTEEGVERVHLARPASLAPASTGGS